VAGRTEGGREGGKGSLVPSRGITHLGEVMRQEGGSAGWESSSLAVVRVGRVVVPVVENEGLMGTTTLEDGCCDSGCIR
jgi:hypothetical protein